MKEVILTGIRSNEEPTLGNYLGAFVPMVQMQREAGAASRTLPVMAPTTPAGTARGPLSRLAIIR